MLTISATATAAFAIAAFTTAAKAEPLLDLLKDGLPDFPGVMTQADSLPGDLLAPRFLPAQDSGASVRQERAPGLLELDRLSRMPPRGHLHWLGTSVLLPI